MAAGSVDDDVCLAGVCSGVSTGHYIIGTSLKEEEDKEEELMNIWRMRKHNFVRIPPYMTFKINYSWRVGRSPTSCQVNAHLNITWGTCYCSDLGAGLQNTARRSILPATLTIAVTKIRDHPALPTQPQRVPHARIRGNGKRQGAVIRMLCIASCYSQFCRPDCLTSALYSVSSVIAIASSLCVAKVTRR